MPERHGVVIEAGPACQLGILGVLFDPFLRGPLKPPYDPQRVDRPTCIHFHLRSVCRRLFRSLAHLSDQVHSWEKFLADGGLAGPDASLAFTIPDEAGVAADSVIHYLNLLMDDVARMIPFVLTEGEAQEPERFNDLKTKIQNGRLDSPSGLRLLFEKLDNEGSWWSVGFAWGIGMRQRLVHYTDLVILEGMTRPGDDRISAEMSLSTVGGPVRYRDFETTLRQLFLGFFNWLDAVEQELLTRLSERIAPRGTRWNATANPYPPFSLPPREKTALAGAAVTDYLYMPMVSLPT